MNAIKKTFMLLLLMNSIAVSVSASEGWTLSKGRNDVKVYTRGDEKTNVREARAFVTINSDNLGKITDYFLNFQEHSNWLFKVEISRILEKVSDNEYYIYYATESVWPVAPRDVILHYKIESTEDKIMIKTTATPKYKKERDQYVRVKDASSEWVISREAPGKIQVEYFNHTDPGGSLPIWIANQAAARIPYMSLLNLKRTIEDQMVQ